MEEGAGTGLNRQNKKQFTIQWLGIKEPEYLNGTNDLL